MDRALDTLAELNQKFDRLEKLVEEMTRKCE